jgi:hypothetical protein
LAIYSASMSTVSRKAGRSSTAAAAYRAGAEIHDERTGLTHDYSKKQGVLHAQLLMPGGIEMERGEFWNNIETHHRRGDAVTARELLLALPAELDKSQRQALAMSVGQHLVERYNVAADICIHAPDRGGDDRNHHAHILMSACTVSPDGQLGKKANELDPIHCKRRKIPTAAEELRPMWADMVNEALKTAGSAERVDHRSHADRGLDIEPTVKMGPSATAMERKGERTERGDINREIRTRNDNVINLFDAAQRLDHLIAQEQQALEAAAQERETERLNQMFEREKQRWIKEKLTVEQLQQRAAAWRSGWRMETAQIAKTKQRLKMLNQRADDPMWSDHSVERDIDRAQQRIERAQKATGIGRKMLSAVVPLAATAELKAAKQQLAQLERERDGLPGAIKHAEQQLEKLESGARRWWGANTELREQLADRIDTDLVELEQRRVERFENSLVGQALREDREKEREKQRREDAALQREIRDEELQKQREKQAQLQRQQRAQRKSKGKDNSLSM